VQVVGYDTIAQYWLIKSSWGVSGGIDTCQGDSGGPLLVKNAGGAWLHGGTVAAISTTITQGRVAAMPAWEGVVGAEGVEQLSNYVLTLSGQTLAPPGKALAAAGAEKFAMFCAACHGADGRGNQALGAPNLTDNIWLYAGNIETIRDTVAKGRNNQMPAHADKLGATRVKLLTAYVLNLSGASEEEPEEHAATESPEGGAHERTDTADTASH
jgi:cytochrome c oxidase cbb3-type subunit 3